MSAQELANSRSPTINRLLLFAVKIIILLYPVFLAMLVKWLAPTSFQTIPSEQITWRFAIALTAAHSLLAGCLIYRYRAFLRAEIDQKMHIKKKQKGQVMPDPFGLWRLAPLFILIVPSFFSHEFLIAKALPHLGPTQQFKMERPIMAAISQRSGSRRWRTTDYYFLTFPINPTRTIDRTQLVRLYDDRAENWSNVSSRCMHLTVQMGLYGAMSANDLRLGGCRHSWPSLTVQQFYGLAENRRARVLWARIGRNDNDSDGGEPLTNPYCEISQGQSSCAY